MNNEKIREYKNQAIALFGFENPHTISIFRIAQEMIAGNMAETPGYAAMDYILAEGMRTELGVTI